MKNRKVKPIRVDGDVAYVPLTKGYEAIIDTADLHLVEDYNWQSLILKHTVYATRHSKRDTEGKRTSYYMHREILQLPADMDVDHTNHNGLDNRRCNIRICTRSENNRNTRLSTKNTSGYKGVSPHKPTGKWVAFIRLRGKSQYIGLFERRIEAHKAYMKAAKKHFGEYACDGRYKQQIVRGKA